MSLLKIEKDGGLVCLRDQCGQNESVIREGGGVGVTDFQHSCDACRSPNTTRLGQSTSEHARCVAGGLVM
jgi:hypothetical protein